eukprot:3694147-Pleurochrysis_carterae.AAC.2
MQKVPRAARARTRAGGNSKPVAPRTPTPTSQYAVGVLTFESFPAPLDASDALKGCFSCMISPSISVIVREVTAASSTIRAAPLDPAVLGCGPAPPI